MDRLPFRGTWWLVGRMDVVEKASSIAACESPQKSGILACHISPLEHCERMGIRVLFSPRRDGSVWAASVCALTILHCGGLYFLV